MHAERFPRAFQRFRFLVVALLSTLSRRNLVTCRQPNHRRGGRRTQISCSQGGILFYISARLGGIVQSMTPKAGEPIHLIIDDTQIENRSV